jgi:hypothetical protein
MTRITTAGTRVHRRTSHVSSVVHDDGRKEAETTLTKGSFVQAPLKGATTLTNLYSQGAFSSLPRQAVMGFGTMARADTEPVQTRRVSRISLVSMDRVERKVRYEDCKWDNGRRGSRRCSAAMSLPVNLNFRNVAGQFFLYEHDRRPCQLIHGNGDKRVWLPSRILFHIYRGCQ